MNSASCDCANRLEMHAYFYFFPSLYTDCTDLPLHITYLFLIGLCGSTASITHLLFVILRNISTAFLKAQLYVKEK